MSQRVSAIAILAMLLAAGCSPTTQAPGSPSSLSASASTAEAQEGVSVSSGTNAASEPATLQNPQAYLPLAATVASNRISGYVWVTWTKPAVGARVDVVARDTGRSARCNNSGPRGDYTCFAGAGWYYVRASLTVNRKPLSGRSADVWFPRNAMLRSDGVNILLK